MFYEILIFFLDSGLVVRRGSEPVLGFNELVTVYGKSSTLIENPARPLGSLKDCLEVSIRHFISYFLQFTQCPEFTKGL